jgi:hypothetical protein
MPKTILVLNSDYHQRTTNLHYYSLFDQITDPNYARIQYTELVGKTSEQIEQIALSLFSLNPIDVSDNIFCIVFFEHLTDIHLLSIPKSFKICVVMVDLHHQGAIKKQRRKNLLLVDRVLASYGYCFKKYYPMVSEKQIHFFPHFTTFDVPFNVDPIEKIAVSGRLNTQIYPFRDIMYNKSKKDSRITYVQPNCSYVVGVRSDDVLCGESYVKKLSEYLIAFTCDASADRPYILAKHFEILSSGALLLAANQHTKEAFESLGFIDRTHYISVTERNLDETISYVLSPENRMIINEIRRNGYDFVRSNHGLANRFEQLDNIIKNID